MGFNLKLPKLTKKLKLLRFFLGIVAILATIQLLILPAFTQQPITVTVLMQALEASSWGGLVEEFNQSNSEINLKIIEGPNPTNQVEDLYTSSFLLGNSPYDLVYMDIVWVPKFAAAGWLKELDDYIDQDNLDLNKYLDGDIEGGRYQEKLYRLPFRSDAGMLYYRQDLLTEAGYQPPETFDELLGISQVLQEEGKAEWGYVWQGKQYEGLAAMFVEILEGSGGFWVNPESLEVGLDQPEAIQAIKFLHRSIDIGVSPPGVTTYTEEETRRLFQNGNAVFLRNWPYVFSLASAEDSPIQGKFAIKPMVSKPEAQSGACQGGWGLGIARSSQHPDAAWEVMKYFSSKDVLRKFVLETGYVPSIKSLFNDSTIVAKYDHYPQLLEVLENPALRPPIAQYAQASDILQRYLSAALTDKMSSEKAMKAAARETRSLLKR